MKPRVAFKVENRLSDDPDVGWLGVDLQFKGIEDFEPQNVAQQVKPLRELLDLRTKLSDLRGSLQGNDALEQLLAETVNDPGKLDKIKAEMGIKPDQGPEGGSNE